MIHIYTLSCPDTGEIKYVGKTSNVKRRKYQHFNKKIARNLSNKHLGNWLLKFLEKDIEPILTVIESIKENWQEREIFWIEEFSKTYKLCNITKGGEGCSKQCSEETKLKISKAQTGVPKKFSEKGIESLRKRFKENNPRTDERFKEKWYANLKKSRGFCKTEEFKEKQKEAHKKRLKNYPAPRSIKVIDVVTNITYESIDSAAIDNNLKPYNLRRYLSGKIKNKTNLRYYEE